jgi:hypothetical protein
MWMPIVSLGGCSASFVSPQGLIVTNHHCVYSYLQFNSTPERDLIENGFLAKTVGEEIPDARVWVTTSIEDVTNRVLPKSSERLSDLERHARGRAAPQGARLRVRKRRTRRKTDALRNPSKSLG